MARYYILFIRKWNDKVFVLDKGIFGPLMRFPIKHESTKVPSYIVTFFHIARGQSYNDIAAYEMRQVYKLLKIRKQ